MPTFRRKPTTIEAEQFQDPATAPVGVRTEEDGRAYVLTAHEQKVYLVPGDWIVNEPNREDRYYPIKADVMELSFELIDSRVRPRRDAIFAEEVPGSNNGFLVTLSCGHTTATFSKQASYPCRECGEEEEAKIPVHLAGKGPEWRFVCGGFALEKLWERVTTDHTLVTCPQCKEKMAP